MHFTYFLFCNSTPKYLSQPFLFCGKILMSQTPTIRYAVFLVRFWFHHFFYFESNRIDRSDYNNNNNNNNLTIPSSTNAIVDVSDRPLPCVNNYHITLNIWIELYQSIWWQQQQRFDNPIINQCDCWCIRLSSSLCE